MHAASGRRRYESRGKTSPGWAAWGAAVDPELTTQPANCRHPTWTDGQIAMSFLKVEYLQFDNSYQHRLPRFLYLNRIACSVVSTVSACLQHCSTAFDSFISIGLDLMFCSVYYNNNGLSGFLNIQNIFFR